MRCVATGDARPRRSRISATTARTTRLRVTLWAGTSDRVVAPVNSALLARRFARLFGIADHAERERRNGVDVSQRRDAAGRTRIELWSIEHFGHAWSGGSFRGSYTSPGGPRASDEMMAFFLGAAYG